MTMTREIPTIEGWTIPSPDDQAYIDYLDAVAGYRPCGHSFGVLLFKADPVSFRLELREWLAEREGRGASTGTRPPGRRASRATPRPRAQDRRVTRRTHS